jgi:hypothetical protein
MEITMGIFGTTDKEATTWINRNAGRYKSECLRNYNEMRRNNSNPKEALENIKSDLKKRGIKI